MRSRGLADYERDALRADSAITTQSEQCQRERDNLDYGSPRRSGAAAPAHPGSPHEPKPLRHTRKASPSAPPKPYPPMLLDSIRFLRQIHTRKQIAAALDDAGAISIRAACALAALQILILATALALRWITH